MERHPLHLKNLELQTFPEVNRAVKLEESREDKKVPYHKQTNTTLKKKVFVGLSGGVDSSVSAALLKKAGYDVTGVFIKVWQPEWLECSWKEERRDAMRAAAHLNISFETLDLSKEYKNDVIDHMIREYSSGRTPNPDVMCNRYVKFGAFWKWAKEKGAACIATGHYARIGQNDKKDNNLRKLLAGRDPGKDQSYFLWTLNQDDLSHVFFPIGHLMKQEVRKLARRFGLPNAEKKDSQGLCFIGKVDVKDFLKHYIKSQPGKVLNEKREVIGVHPGALLFTRGERHGFTIIEKTPNDRRYYVIGKDMDKNEIIVSNREIRDIQRDRNKNQIVKITGTNWVKGIVPPSNGKSGQLKYRARGRYRQELANIQIIEAFPDNAVIEYEKEDETLTPGQSLVIYTGEECLGGGIIEGF